MIRAANAAQERSFRSPQRSETPNVGDVSRSATLRSPQAAYQIWPGGRPFTFRPDRKAASAPPGVPGKRSDPRLPWSFGGAMRPLLRRSHDRASQGAVSIPEAPPPTRPTRGNRGARIPRGRASRGDLRHHVRRRTGEQRRSRGPAAQGSGAVRHFLRPERLDRVLTRTVGCLSPGNPRRVAELLASRGAGPLAHVADDRRDEPLGGLFQGQASSQAPPGPSAGTPGPPGRRGRRGSSSSPSRPGGGSGSAPGDESSGIRDRRPLAHPPDSLEARTVFGEGGDRRLTP